MSTAKAQKSHKTPRPEQTTMAATPTPIKSADTSTKPAADTEPTTGTTAKPRIKASEAIAAAFAAKDAIAKAEANYQAACADLAAALDAANQPRQSFRFKGAEYSLKSHGKRGHKGSGIWELTRWNSVDIEELD